MSSNVVDQTIVVDAELSDSLFNQCIKRSYLNSVGNQQFNGVSNAKVIVEDDLGNEITFTETTSGYYVAFFGADRARKYRLDIRIPNGGRITSDFQGLPPPVQIDSATHDTTVIDELVAILDARQPIRDCREVSEPELLLGAENRVVLHAERAVIG